MADPASYTKGDWTNLVPAATKAKMDNIENGIKANNDALVAETDAGRAITQAADVAAQHTALGLGDSATLDVGTGAGDVAAGNAPAGAVTTHESTYAHANIPTAGGKADADAIAATAGASLAARLQTAANVEDGADVTDEANVTAIAVATDEVTAAPAHWWVLVAGALKRMTHAGWTALVLAATGKTNAATGFTLAGGTTSKTLTVSADADSKDIPTADEKTRLGDIQAASGATTREKIVTLVQDAREFCSQARFGDNPAFVASNPWLGTPAGTSKKEWISNADGSFYDGDNYLKLTCGDNAIAGIMEYAEIPEAYRYNTALKARVVVKYIANEQFRFRVYQQTSGYVWCNPNTDITLVLEPTNGTEATAELIVPLLWDGYYLVPYIDAIDTAGSVIKIGSVRFSILGNAIEPKTKTVTVAAGWGDYPTITAAIAASTGTKANPVDIMIYPGTYVEELTLKDYVNLIGIDRDTCIISSIDTPGDEANRDVIKAYFNCTIKNLTINGHYCKYCIHGDGGTDYTATVENCVLDKLISPDGHGSGIGLGLRGGQHFIVKNCHIRADVWGVYCHNWDDETTFASLEIENSYVEGTIQYGLYLQSLGSSMADIVILKGNKFVGGEYSMRIGRNTSYGHNQDDFIILASGNQIETYAKSESSAVPFSQPIVTVTSEVVI